MNCFQISIFAVANTTIWNGCFGIGLLWIAFKLVSLQLQTQLFAFFSISLWVVNCFQISIFAVANTTSTENTAIPPALWIAFKLVSLQLQTQPRWVQREGSIVVNCFQISIFAVANTTATSGVCFDHVLWIAFKLVSLQLQTQRAYWAVQTWLRCELLSN